MGKIMAISWDDDLVTLRIFLLVILWSTFPYLSGWWYTYPSEKYEFVSWDYYSQYPLVI